MRDSGGGGSFEFELPVPGGGSSGVQWAYPVPDDQSDSTGGVVLSIAHDGKIYLGIVDLSSLDPARRRGDLAAALASISWVELQLPIGAFSGGYTGVADHAHVFAFGSHWISMQLAGAVPSIAHLDARSENNDVWLLRVERADIEAAISTGGKVGARREVLVLAADFRRSRGSASIVQDFDRVLATNDHFLVATPDGVAVALQDPSNRELRFIVVDPFLMQGTADVTFGNYLDPQLSLNTTGSARPPRLATGGGTWRVMAPDTVVTNVDANNLRLFDTGASLATPAAPAATLTVPGYSLQMPSFETLLNGDILLAGKAAPCTTAAVGPSYGDDTPVVGDWGYLLLLVYDSGLSALRSAVLLQDASSAPGEGGNRPHVNRWGRWLLACWDVADLDQTALPEPTASGFRSKFRVFWLEDT